jgi:hypothetical protein
MGHYPMLVAWSTAQRWLLILDAVAAIRRHTATTYPLDGVDFSK